MDCSKKSMSEIYITVWLDTHHVEKSTVELYVFLCFKHTLDNIRQILFCTRVRRDNLRKPQNIGYSDA